MLLNLLAVSQVDTRKCNFSLCSSQLTHRQFGWGAVSFVASKENSAVFSTHVEDRLILLGVHTRAAGF